MLNINVSAVSGNIVTLREVLFVIIISLMYNKIYNCALKFSILAIFFYIGLGFQSA